MSNRLMFSQVHIDITMIYLKADTELKKVLDINMMLLHEVSLQASFNAWLYDVYVIEWFDGEYLLVQR